MTYTLYPLSRGQVVSRAQVMEIVTNPNFEVFDGVHDEVVVRPLTADTGVVVHRWRGTGRYENHRFDDDHRCTTVWVHNDIRWQVVHEHWTAILTAPSSS